MPKQSALKLVDNIADDLKRAGKPVDDALRAQVAFIRALVDEVERHHPEDRWIPALHEQLGDELSRLAQLVKRAPSAAAEGEAEPARAIDLLVVDDEEDARRSVCAVLRDLGYPYRAVNDAEQALREFDREPAAIVMSDWSMPGMSGLELCLALKRRDPRPYVILVTAFHENARLLDDGRGRADDFIRKPINLDELEARLLAASRLIRALCSVAGLNDRLHRDRGVQLGA